MGGPWGVHLSKNVSRGETIDISVDMISPSAPGDYTGIWMMADGNGNVFGKQFQVRITVADSGLFACALVSSQQDGPGIVGNVNDGDFGKRRPNPFAFDRIIIEKDERVGSDI